MTNDLIADLGYLCLGSRLKRLGERLQGDVARFLGEMGLDVQPAQYPLLVALEEGASTIGGLVERIGISQPGVTRSIARLIEVELVESVGRSKDQRFRSVQLTDRGRHLLRVSRETVFFRIEAAVSDICADLSGPLLGQLTAIEAALAETPLDARARRISAESVR